LIDPPFLERTVPGVKLRVAIFEMLESPTTFELVDKS